MSIILGAIYLFPAIYLCEKNPNFTSPDGHLLYEQTLAQLGQNLDADREYQSLLGYKDRIDFKINYAQFLVEQQRYAEAIPLLTELLRSHSLMNRVAQCYNQHWKQQANKSLEIIDLQK